MSSYEYLHISVKKLPKNAGEFPKGENRHQPNIFTPLRRQYLFRIAQRRIEMARKRKNYSTNAKMY